MSLRTGSTEESGLSLALSLKQGWSTARTPGFTACGDMPSSSKKKRDALHLDGTKAGQCRTQQAGRSLVLTLDLIPGLQYIYSTFTMAPKPPLSVSETPSLRSAKLVRLAPWAPSSTSSYCSRVLWASWWLSCSWESLLLAYTTCGVEGEVSGELFPSPDAQPHSHG